MDTTSSGSQLLHIALKGMVDKLSTIRWHLSHFGAQEKKVDRALCNIEDSVASALIALETNATEPYKGATYCAKDLVQKHVRGVREDIIRVHDLFHEAADQGDTPAVFRFSVEALVQGFNVIVTIGRYDLMERMADPSATEAERLAARAILGPFEPEQPSEPQSPEEDPHA